MDITNRQNTVIFDLDGTLANIDKRRDVSTKDNGKLDWDKFFDPKNISLDNIKEPLDINEAPQCMPDEYKDESTIQAYRNYYNGGKAYMAKWKNTVTPEWFKPEVNQ